MKATLPVEPRPQFLETLEDRIAPVGDLVGAFTGFTTPGGGDTLVPGESLTVKFAVKNIGAADSSGANDVEGGGGVHFYLSLDNDYDSGVDYEIAAVGPLYFNVKPGGTKTISAKLDLAPFQVGTTTNLAPGTYYVIARVDPQNFLPETNDTNNTTVSEFTFNYANEFGAVGNRTGVKLTGYGDDGSKFTLALPGGGTGIITSGAEVDINIYNTTAKTTLSSKLVADIRNISASQMKSVILPGVSVHGDAEFSGGVQTLFLADIGGANSDLILGGVAKQVTLGRVNDLNITAGGIGTLAVIDWNTDNTDTILAQYITNLKVLGASKAGIAGDFEPSISLSGTTSPKGVTLSEVSIAGNITGGTWRIDQGNVGDITAESAQAWKLNVVAGLVSDVIMTGGDLPGFLAGDKSGGGYTMRATSFDKIVVNGDIDAKIVATGADTKDFAIDSIIADSVRGAVVQTTQGGIGVIDIDEWVTDGSITSKWIGTIKTNNKVSSGDFEPDVTITGAKPRGYGLLNAGILGTVRNASWLVFGDALRFSALGMEGSTVNIGGGIETLFVGSTKPGYSFKSSNINVGNTAGFVAIGDVDESNTGSTYGLTVGAITHYERLVDGKKDVSLTSSRTEALSGQIDQVGKYRALVEGLDT